MSQTAEADKTVMVVEDDMDCLDVVTEILELSSYRVVQAKNGREALDALERGERPGVILLDLMLPVMNGWQFRGEQLKDPDVAAIPVILATAGRDGRSAARALGAADYLGKPVDLTELLEKIGRHFP